MATVVRLKNPKHLGVFTKEHFVVRRETYAYTLSNGKLVVSKKLLSGTKITLVECTAVYSDNSEKIINQMSSGGKKLDCALMGKITSYTGIKTGDVPILVDSADIFWEDDINGRFDSAYRIPTSTQTSTQTTQPSTQSQSSQSSQSEQTQTMGEYDTPAYTAYSNGDSVNVRESASSASGVKILGKLNKGDTITVSNYNSSPPGDWTRVIYKGTPAYVATSLLSKTKPTTSKPPSISQTKPKVDKVSNLSVMNAEESFFTPVVIISGIAAIGLLAWSMWPKSGDKGSEK